MWKAQALLLLLAATFAACGPDKESGGGQEASAGNPGSTATLTGGAAPGRFAPMAAQGGPNPAPLSFSLRNNGDCALAYAASTATVDGKAWFAVSPASGTLASLSSATLSVPVDVVGTALAPGTYTGTITLAGTCATSGEAALGSPLAIAVNLTVTPVELPDTAIVSHPTDPTRSTSASFTFTSTVAGASFECSLDAGAFVACAPPKAYSGLADGAHAFQVRAIDASGNADPTPASFAWVIDTTLPVLTGIVVTPRDSAVARGASRSFAAVGFYSNSTSQDITAQSSWSSSDTAVATVNASGSATGIAVGSTVISAVLDGIAGQTTLTVSATALPRTGQTACYTQNGTIRSCAGTGEDGERQAGVAWPVPRFVVLIDPVSQGNCVLDQLTGLEWVRVPDTTRRSWIGNPSIFSYSAAFALCGADDWRVPNRRELRSLLHYGQANAAAWLNDPAQGFGNIQGDVSSLYWTSTTFANDSASAWAVYFSDGVTVDMQKTINYVWLARSPAIAAPAAPQRTGQTTSYALEDDGALQAGVAWPDPRFTNLDGSVPLNGGVVVDRLTGLVWTRDGAAPGPAACTPGPERGWQQSLNFIACLNADAHLGYTDWRLPNAVEIESLANLGVMDTSAWLNGLGFSNVRSAPYWSSTTVASRFDYVWSTSLYNSATATSSKTNSFNIWPVRGGP